MNRIDNKRVAILATNGFEQSELLAPMKAIENNGGTPVIISPEAGSIKGWNNDNWGESVEVDITLEEANANDFDALMLPGGVINPDLLRRNAKAVNLVKDFFKSHKPVAAICHAPQMLIEAEVIEGRELTSFSSIKKDLINAGAKWFDKAVVVDAGLVTSRSPEDLEAFNNKMLEEIAEGKHEEQVA